MSSGSRAKRSAPYRLIAMGLESSAALCCPPAVARGPSGRGMGGRRNFRAGHGGNRVGHALMHPADERIGIEPDPKYQQDKRHKGGEFPLIQVPEFREMVWGWDPEDHALDHPEKIGGGENDAQRGKGSRDLAPEERADEHEKFSDKTIGAGEAERGQGENHQQRGIQRHRRRPIRHCRQSTGYGCAHR